VQTGSIAEIAKLEFKIQLRGRWMLGFGSLFAMMISGVSYYGLTFLGYEAEFQDFYRTTVTMLHLVFIIIPVVTLVAAGQSVSSDPGYFEFLASQPVGRSDILLGKVAGLFAALTIMTVLGFGLGGMVIALKSNSEGIWKFFVFIGTSLALGLVFISISTLLSVLSNRKPMAIVSALIVWLFFLFIYDLIVLATSYYMEEAYLRTILYFSLLGNPIDMARVMVLLTVGGEAALGAAGAGLLRTFGGPVTFAMSAVGLLAIWALIPLLGAVLVFKKQDIA
jgi:Cu-processing system permease protein